MKKRHFFKCRARKNMNSLKELCKEIQMPEEAAERMLAAEIPFSQSETDRLIQMLTDERSYAEAAGKAAEAEGFAGLKIFLLAALKTREIYAEKGIPEEIFAATMKCFSRFVREHKEYGGGYGFDRGHWVGRQLSLLLFRLGELEYERLDYEGRPALFLHIPSDADLSPDKLDASFAQAKAFFARHFPAYVEAKIYCCSWLLAPALEKLLPPASKILRFQKRFRIIKTDEEASDFTFWVFRTKGKNPQDFPENTTLQKNMKAYLLCGGKVGEALGEKLP